MPPGVLVEGSQNVLLNDGERVAVRQGYTLDGQANDATTPIVSATDWERHTGDIRHLRSYYDELEYRYVDADGVVTWNRLENGWGDNVLFRFADFWDPSEEINQLLFVNGTSNIYSWSGGVTTFASATANTITKEGSTTWAEEGFLTTGTRRVVIDGTAYTYTGGEGTTTLTGVTPDPTLGSYPAGTVVVQQIQTHANSASTGLPVFNNDLIAILYNQVYIGCETNRSVYVSQQNSFTNFSFSATRTPGQGAILTLDAFPVGFVPQEDVMYITAGMDQWYTNQFTLSSDNTKEFLTIQRLKTTSQEAAQSQELISKIKNYVFFVTNEPTLDTLGKLQLIDTPQSVNISDPIKTFFSSLDFSNGQNFYWRNYMLISAPSEGLVLVYNLAKGFWEAPQVLPFRRFSIIDGDLYGHSSTTPETFKMFDGYSDNGNPINAIARFSYMQFGDRSNNKSFNMFYNEGYISSNTTLNLRLIYDYLGSSGILSFTINGNDGTAVHPVAQAGSLGKQSLGKRSLAGRGTTQDTSLPPKYRVIKSMRKIDFYEVQVEYSSNDVDQRWELLAWGPNATMSTSTNANITE